MLLHLCVSWQLLSGREEGSADGGESCTEELESTFSTTTMGHLHQQMQEPGPTQPGHTLFLPLVQESAQHQEQNHQTEEQLLPEDR